MRRSWGRGVIAVFALTFLGLAGSGDAGAAKKAKAKGKEKAENKAQPAADGGGGQAVKPGAGEDLADFIVGPAQEAVKERDYELAISLWRGVVAIRGAGDEAAWELAKAWTLAGEFDDAIKVLEAYEAAVADAAKKQKAQEEIAALKGRQRGFGKPAVPKNAKAQAAAAFKKGMAAFKKKQYERAAIYFKAGIVMAPDLPGNYRELGAALDKLGRGQEANDFFLSYLQMRPFGKNGDFARTRLQKAKLTGKLSVVSSFPCDEVWINGQIVPKKLPIKNHVVAPGTYKMLCFNDEYHHAQFETITVAAGASQTLSFDYAVLVDKLNPWGRVVVENPYNPQMMTDLGPFPAWGVPVPKDRRALKVVIIQGANPNIRKEELIKLEPGKKYELKW